MLSILGSSNVASRTAKRVRDISGPGLKNNHAMAMNKKARLDDSNQGSGPKDTQQNAISTTALMLPPPTSLEDPDTVDPETLYAPPSKSPLANIPQRGEWAMTVSPDQPGFREVADWLHRSGHVGVGMNQYGKAVPVFTNLGGVPRGLKITYAGIVGNHGQSGTECNPNGDNWGQFYNGGSISGDNTGPVYIPPLSLVYLSPYPYKVTGNNKQAVKGFRKPGWPDDCDKWVAATYPLRDSDVMVLFKSIHMTLDDAVALEVAPANNPNFKPPMPNMNKLSQALLDMDLENSLPAAIYAKMYAEFLHVKRAYQVWRADPLGGANGQRKANMYVDSLKNAETGIKAFWQKMEQQRAAIRTRLGCPAEDSMGYCYTVPASLPTALDLADEMVKVTEAYNEILQMQFTEQHNFMRSQVMGKARYGAPPGKGLDLMSGYGIN